MIDFIEGGLGILVHHVVLVGACGQALEGRIGEEHGGTRGTGWVLARFGAAVAFIADPPFLHVFLPLRGEHMHLWQRGVNYTCILWKRREIHVFWLIPWEYMYFWLKGGGACISC